MADFLFFVFYEPHTWQFIDLKCILYVYPIDKKIIYKCLKHLLFLYKVCEAKGSGDSDPFDIKSKAHTEEEEVPEDE